MRETELIPAKEEEEEKEEKGRREMRRKVTAITGGKVTNGKMEEKEETR